MNIVYELRKKKGIQQKELAIIIGVAQPTVSEWEKQKKDPSGERLKQLAEYFGVDELVILGKGIQAPEPPAMPTTTEAKILSAGIDRMPEADRKRVLKMVELMFEQYKDFFESSDTE